MLLCFQPSLALNRLLNTMFRNWSVSEFFQNDSFYTVQFKTAKRPSVLFLLLFRNSPQTLSTNDGLVCYKHLRLFFVKMSLENQRCAFVFPGKSPEPENAFCRVRAR